MQEIQVQSLGWEDALEKGMATHSSILTWRISWTEEPGGLQPMGSEGVGHDGVTNTSNFHFCEKLHKSGVALKLHLLSRQTPSIRPAGLFGWHGGRADGNGMGEGTEAPLSSSCLQPHRKDLPHLFLLNVLAVCLHNKIFYVSACDHTCLSLVSAFCLIYHFLHNEVKL